MSSAADAFVPSRIRSEHPLHEPWRLTTTERERYRKIAKRSREQATLAAGGLLDPLHEVNTPLLDPDQLMEQMDPHGLRALSLYSGV